jgi:hypothetical protein
MGTVGWNDGSKHFDVGTGDNGGVTLLKVQLFRGRDRSVAATPGRAQGTAILARIPNPANFIPPDGTHVLVCRPAGFDAWMLIQQYGPNSTTQFSSVAPSSKGKNRAKVDYGPDVDVVFKARSITFCDYQGRFFSMGPEFGLQVADKDGSGWHFGDGQWLCWIAVDGDAKSSIKMISGDVKAFAKDDTTMGGWEVNSGGFKATGTSFVAATSNVALGGAATPVTPVLTGFSAFAAVPSTSVYVQI